MIDPPSPGGLQVVETVMQGGALACLIFAIVAAIKAGPKIAQGILAQHDKMLTTFSATQQLEREACDRRFREIAEEIRRDTGLLVAEIKSGNDVVTELMRDLAARNFDAIRERNHEK